MNTINVGDAKSRFSELISRAAAGERFLIRRRERPVAVLISATELERLERRSQAANQLALSLGQSAELMKQIDEEKIHPAMAAFGLWRDETELTTLGDDIYSNRQRQAGRAEVEL
jgi:prevent-host-death family protein